MKLVLVTQWKCGHQWADTALRDPEWPDSLTMVSDAETGQVRLSCVPDMDCSMCKFDRRIRERYKAERSPS